MGFESIRNKKFGVFILMVLTVASLCGCDGMYGKYPHDISSEWICEDPVFSFSYTMDGSTLLDDTATVSWNEKTIPVDIDFQANQCWVLPADSRHYDDRLLTGTWKYKDGVLILYAEEDFLFDCKYSELVFSPAS